MEAAYVSTHYRASPLSNLCLGHVTCVPALETGTETLSQPDVSLITSSSLAPCHVCPHQPCLLAPGRVQAVPPRALPAASSSALLMPLGNLLELCQERRKSLCWQGHLCPQDLRWLWRGRNASGFVNGPKNRLLGENQFSYSINVQIFN